MNSLLCRRHGPVWLSFVLAGACWLPVGSSADESRELVSRVAPGMAIVTEISNSAPYAGQQFSIIYSLLSLQPPAAVDIDPQQFTGFWTESSVPAADAPASSQMLDSQQASRYLLRQVIAFPLFEGIVQLPPLRLKIKLPGSRSVPGEWDLVCSSESVMVRVLPVPGVAGMPPTFIGTLEGNWSQGKGAGPDELTLEVQGTANLAFLDPSPWIGKSPELAFLLQPTEWDKLVQTRDIGGKRTITLLQRRCWRLRIIGKSKVGMRIGEVPLRMFQPSTGLMVEKRIAGVTIASGEEKATSRGPARQYPKSGWSRMTWLSLLLAGLAIVFCAWAFTHARGSRRRDRAACKLASLERSAVASPKSFLDAAHRVIERHATEAGLLNTIGRGDSELDRLWNEVERLRFGHGSPSSELRRDILRLLEKLV